MKTIFFTLKHPNLLEEELENQVLTENLVKLIVQNNLINWSQNLRQY